uniref:Photosystem I assembly protein Ycf4 n=1 Tax=Trachelomonas grandis TaxID=215769 RepID=A0A385UK10_9EUGL|nr:photosystem I assembly protein Ycf4 [Trachelomonas grandis]
MNKEILRQEITITNKTTQNLTNLLMFFGSIGFLLTGIASYINETILIIFEGDKIVFFPQGLTMLIYGITGTLLTINQIITYMFNFGEGYNEFNKSEKKMTIFRKGMPGRNKDIELNYPLNDIDSIKIEIKKELFQTKKNVLIILKGNTIIPIIQTNNVNSIKEIEEKATELAYFLNIRLINNL